MRHYQKFLFAAICTTAVWGGMQPRAAASEDVYYSVPLHEWLPSDLTPPDESGEIVRLVVEGQGEAFLMDWTLFEPEGVRLPDPISPGRRASRTPPNNRIVARAPEGRDLRLAYYSSDRGTTTTRSLAWTIPEDRASDDARKAFFAVKAWYYARLAARGGPGTAWFRHEARLARAAYGEDAADSARSENRGSRQTSQMQRTCDLFSGGRAMAENLQLDAVLEIEEDKDRTIDVDSIRGISVAEIDWDPLVEGLDPALDPLADRIPHDQHAIFFSSLADAMELLGEVDRHGIPIFEMTQTSATDAHTFERYEKQLALPLRRVAAELGPDHIKSIAVTGSDIDFATGTDVALLLEVDDPDATLKRLSRLVEETIDTDIGLSHRLVSGSIDGVDNRFWVTDERDLACHLADVGGVVVITNSGKQYRRLVETAAGTTKSIASLPEYTFFRDRYPVGDKGETAFVFLSDATIRRWCGPRWRIGASRRMRQTAVLAELQAEHMDRLLELAKVRPVSDALRTRVPGPPLATAPRAAAMRASERPRTIKTDLPVLDGAKITLSSRGVRSSVYGSLHCMTPIIDLPIRKVTEAEREAYQTWRDRYEGIWRRTFDPIGLRLSIRDDRLASDLTIMPLAVDSRYDAYVRISEGAALEPRDGDPHAAPIQYILALNKDSELFRRNNDLIQSLGMSLWWVGDYMTIYVDEDPIWDEWQRQAREAHDLHDILFDNASQLVELPLALAVDVESPLKLAAFLAAFRGFVEQSAPELVTWETREYKNVSYVRISPTEETAETAGHDVDELAVYYLPSGQEFLVTLSENLLRRAIDRRLAHKSASGEASASDSAEPAPWLGENLALRLERRVFRLFEPIYHQSVRTTVEKSLPILTELKLAYPDADPVSVYEAVWGERILCPDGVFRWDARRRRMTVSWDESPSPSVLSPIRRAEFGVTFENEGLRARAVVERTAEE